MLIFEVCLWPCVGVGARGAQVVCGARDPEARWSGVASPPFVILPFAWFEVYGVGAAFVVVSM